MKSALFTLLVVGLNGGLVNAANEKYPFPETCSQPHSGVEKENVAANKIINDCKGIAYSYNKNGKVVALCESVTATAFISKIPDEVKNSKSRVSVYNKTGDQFFAFNKVAGEAKGNESFYKRICQAGNSKYFKVDAKAQSNAHPCKEFSFVAKDYPSGRLPDAILTHSAAKACDNVAGGVEVKKNIKNLVSKAIFQAASAGKSIGNGAGVAE